MYMYETFTPTMSVAVSLKKLVYFTFIIVTLPDDFKPASVDVNKMATVDVGTNNQVTVTVPHLGMCFYIIHNNSYHYLTYILKKGVHNNSSPELKGEPDPRRCG